MSRPTFMECAEIVYGRRAHLAVRTLITLACAELVLIGFLLGMVYSHIAL